MTSDVRLVTLVWSDGLAHIYRASDDRYYVFNADDSDNQSREGGSIEGWHSSNPDLAGALASARFTRTFWEEKEQMKDDPDVVRADGHHYHIGGKTNSPFKGFGGVEWKITFHDGRVVYTNNLWSNGTIPKGMRERLPDNAVLVQESPPTSHPYYGG